MAHGSPDAATGIAKNYACLVKEAPACAIQRAERSLTVRFDGGGGRGSL